MTDDYTNEDAPGAEAREEQTGTEQETALLARSLFAGKDLEVGSECKVRIVHIFEDEVEVEYIKHYDEKESTDTDEGPSMREAMGRFDGMAGEA